MTESPPALSIDGRARLREQPVGIIHPVGFVTAQTAFCSSSAPGTAPLRFRERAKARVGTAELLVFRVGNERFAVELPSVRETVESPVLHGVPESSPTVLGVFADGEHFVPLYDTGVVLGMTLRAESCDAALIMRGGSRSIGIAVSDVEDVLNVELTALRDVPAGVWDDDLLLGLFVHNGDLIALLDARALVAVCHTAPVPEAL